MIVERSVEVRKAEPDGGHPVDQDQQPDIALGDIAQPKLVFGLRCEPCTDRGEASASLMVGRQNEQIGRAKHRLFYFADLDPASTCLDETVAAGANGVDDREN